MIDKQYRERMMAIVINQKNFIASTKRHYRAAHYEWLSVMGFMETWDFIDER